MARLLREAGAGLETEYSHSLAHAQDIARKAGEQGRIVLAVGGDGITGGIGGALSGTGTVFGIVPAGRGNDFARALELPADPAALADILLHAEPRPVDTIEVESAVHRRTVVLGSVYAGVDALANRYANQTRLLRGAAAYYAGGLRAVTTGGPPTTASRSTARSTPTAATRSSPPTPLLRLRPADRPGARVDDGLLHIVMIKEAPRRLFFTLMNELKTGTHIRRPEVRVLRAKELRIESTGPVPYGADGEVEATLPVTVRVRPGDLPVLYRPADTA